MTRPPESCLSMARAMDYVGDLTGVIGLLGTLAQCLQDDLPRLQACIDGGDLSGAHRLLHQLKGFVPVFCVDSLVTDVLEAEALSKGQDTQALRQAYARLGPRLHQLLSEVQARRAGQA